MGQRQSRAEAKAQKIAARRNKKNNKLLATEALKQERIIKLLLLGAGESGKSTFFKQIITLYGPGFNEAEMKSFVPGIHNNIVRGMQTLVVASKTFPEELGTRMDLANADVKSAAFYFEDDRHRTTLEVQRCAHHLRALWSDQGIRNTFENRSKIQIADSFEFFMEGDAIDRIAQPSYHPTFEDIMRCRKRTSGVVERQFKIGTDQFKLIDVGGQRSERKKWMQAFGQVTAVIFVAAINEYDMTLFEDESTNRMRETMDLFDQTCNSAWFDEASMILFLNKTDLFKKKIEVDKVPMEELFADYTGGPSYDAGCEYLEGRFRTLNKDMKLFVHFTCATDSGLVQRTFDFVKQTVIINVMKNAGLFVNSEP